MSLKSKIEAVIYASEEPVTLQQLVGLLAGEAQAELDEMGAQQAALPLDGEGERSVVEAESREHDELDEAVAEALEQGEIAGGGAAEVTAEAVAEPEPDEAAPVEAAVATEPATAAPVVEGGADGEPAADSSSEGEAVASTEAEKKQQRERERLVREHVRRVCDQLIREYAESDRGIEIREVASGFRMGTKPEYHDAVRGFVKSLKPALKLTLPALETLAVVAYKQPVTAAEISEIRGVDSAGVLGGLMTRKLIATAGRKQVIGRPMLYKTTRDFLLRFGLKDVNELPSMEEFERMAGELAEQEDLPMDGAEGIIEEANARGDAEMIREASAAGEKAAEALNEAGEGEDAASATEQEATAESAAGGNDEEVNEEQPVTGDESNEAGDQINSSAEASGGSEAAGGEGAPREANATDGGSDEADTGSEEEQNGG